MRPCIRLALDQQVAGEEMAGRRSPSKTSSQVAAPASRIREAGTADPDRRPPLRRSPRVRFSGYEAQIVAVPGRTALREIETETELAEDQKFVAHERRRPVARARRRLDRGQQTIERGVELRVSAGLPEGRSWLARTTHSTAAAGKRLDEQGCPALHQLDGQLRELLLGPRAKFGLNEVARMQYRTQPSRATAANIAGLDARLRASTPARWRHARRAAARRR